MGRHIFLKHIPKLTFKLDRSFEEAGRINQLLQDPRVREDLKRETEEE